MSIGRALLIQAESEAARAFSLWLAEFEPAPTGALHLFLLMRDVKATAGPGPCTPSGQ